MSKFKCNPYEIERRIRQAVDWAELYPGAASFKSIRDLLNDLDAEIDGYVDERIHIALNTVKSVEDAAEKRTQNPDVKRVSDIQNVAQ